MTPPPALDRLIQTWREGASGAEGYSVTNYEAGYIAGARRCADELEQALAALPKPEADGYTSFGEFRWACDCDERMKREWTPVYTAPLPQQEADCVLVPREPTLAMRTAHEMYGDTSDWWIAVVAAATSNDPTPIAQQQGEP